VETGTFGFEPNTQEHDLYLRGTSPEWFALRRQYEALREMWARIYRESSFRPAYKESP
jgi:hypothetical protein